ncbi:MAG: UDP-N-acetylglucosamine 1-carboxyvinyltransferase [Thermodesulfobacteriota bacterium]
MDEIWIRGGRPLAGEVAVSGAKNAALPILFASLLTPETCRIENVPQVVDCRTTQRLLAQMGVAASSGDDAVTLAAREVTALEAPYDLVKTMRASFLALGPLLARFGEARVATPGGCAIGSRPVNLHLRGFERMGATITQSHGYVEARAPRDASGRPRLRAAHIVLEMPSVGATENLMLAASLAEGTTVLDNAAREPEIVDLAAVLARMGAVIRGAGSATIEVEGRERLGGFAHRVIPDRIEAGTLLMAVAAAGGDVIVREARADHLTLVIEKLVAAGVEITPVAGGIRVRRERPLRSVDVRTAPYPGFPTDLQAQFMALMCLADGSSEITETVFENRFMHVQELVRMGADIRLDGPKAIVAGGARLEGAPVMATDLRASVCLVVAALGAKNTTRLQRVYHLDRGYERLEAKLAGIGADVERVPEGATAAAAAARRGMATRPVREPQPEAAPAPAASKPQRRRARLLRIAE